MRLEVVGPSMEPTLAHGDRVLVNRLAYVLRHPSVGEIVTATFASVPSELVIKRVRAVTLDGSSFLVGDNAEQSTDSRHLGPAMPRAIVGRVWYRYWPPSGRGKLPPTGSAAG